MASHWYYSRTGQQEGPVDSKTLRGMAESGELKPEHHVRKEGMAEWRQADKIKGLIFKDLSPPPVVNTPVSLPQKSTTPDLEEAVKVMQIALKVKAREIATKTATATKNWLMKLEERNAVQDANQIQEPPVIDKQLKAFRSTFRLASNFLESPSLFVKTIARGGGASGCLICLFFLLALSMLLQGLYNVYTSYELSPLIGEWKLETNEHSTMTITKSIFSKHAVGGGKEFHADGFVTQPNIAKAFHLMEAMSNKDYSTDLSNPVYNDKIWGQWALKEGKLYIVESINWYEPSDVKRWGLGDFNNIYVKSKE